MNDSPIRKFCESTHRKLIVVIVTTLVGLVVLTPLVDEYFNNKESRRALTEELGLAQETAKRLPAFEKRVAKLAEEIGRFEKRSVSQDSLSQYRSRLVEMIRDSGCQVRRIDVSAPTLRPWLENDNPLKKPTPGNATAKHTPFVLERRDVALSVDGTMENIRGLLDKIHEDDTFAYPQQMKLRAAGRRGGSVALDLELRLFALSRGKTT